MYAALWRPPQEGDAAGLRGIAEVFSPRYEVHRDDLVIVDVSGLERLLGPAAAIAGEVHREAVARSMRVHVAVAGTQSAAIVLAIARPGVTVVERGGEATALAPVPIAILDQCSFVRPASDVVPTFTRWGLKTLGELAVLPDADLTARFSLPARAWQALARGVDLRPLVPALPEERFESTLDLEWPIEGLEPLSFVLTRLLEPLSTRLERRDRGAAVLHVVLGLVTNDPYARRLELPSPIRDVRTLRTLALLDLEAHPPPAAIDRVTVVIDPTPGRVLQHTLFTRAQPTPEQLSTLVARLGAVMGQDRFGAPAVVDSHRPGAFELTAFRAGEAGRAGRAGREIPLPPLLSTVPSALRRFRHPVPARVVMVDDRPVRVTTDRRGYAGGSVLHAAGPWRSSGQWWSGEPSKSEVRSLKSEVGVTSDFKLQTSNFSLPWDRDEWDVSVNDGAVYRIFRDRRSGAWFIDAIVD